MATLRRDGAQNITFCLPEEVVEHIFTFLPIKNVIQTSLVAKRFEKSWLLARKLNFDREFALKHGPFDSVNIVNRVLSSHSGPEIKILTLHFNPDEYNSEADKNESLMEIWIQKCCEKGLEELDLDIFHAMWPYYLPSSFIEVETLKVLRLSNVILNLPPNPKGLSLLTTLVLKKVNIYDLQMVDTVFHHCALLETFDLSNCWGICYLRIPARKLKCFKVLKVGGCTDIARIDIDAPTLRSLYYNGAVCHFQVSQRFLHLNEAMLNIVPPTGLMSPFYVEGLVANLCDVDVFTTSSTLLEKIRDGYFRGIYYCFRNLKELQLFLEGPSLCDVDDILSFMTKCPCLEKLFIDLNEHYFSGAGRYLELFQKPDVEKNFNFYNQLKFVRIKGFKFQGDALYLVKQLLEKAKFMETMVLVLPMNGIFNTIHPRNLPTYARLFDIWTLPLYCTVIICGPLNEKFYDYPKHSKTWY